MAVANWTPEQEYLALMNGVCLECGSPLMLNRIVETHPDGSVTDFTRLLCTSEPVRHPKG